MRHLLSAAVAALLLTGFVTDAHAQYSRRTPIVEAVQKTRASVVAVKVQKKDAYDRPRETNGTGVIIDERGYIVTSNHVVAGATQVTVALDDGTELDAHLLAEETETDLAILKVRPEKPLHALPLGPGSDLMVGENVIAVGHPYGYSYSVSTGIVSALGRDITMPTGEVLSNLIQTNASINPGNSGGPLLNINGELIGINAALRDGAQGIAFAVNAETVKDMLRRNLSVRRTAGLSHGLKCKERVEPEGANRQHVVVAEVVEETPAAQAGLRKGDEIRLVAGRQVCNRFDIERALWGRRPGEPVSLTVVRQGKEQKVALTLAEAPAPVHAAAPRPSEGTDPGPAQGAGDVNPSR